MTVLLWVNVVGLIVVGGVFSVVALLPFAMANDDPRCGPLVRYGLLQIPAYLGLWVWLVLGVWRALRAVGTGSLGAGALGWLVWAGGVVVTMVVFFAVAKIDMARAGRRGREG